MRKQRGARAGCTTARAVQPSGPPVASMHVPGTTVVLLWHWLLLLMTLTFSSAAAAAAAASAAACASSAASCSAVSLLNTSSMTPSTCRGSSKQGRRAEGGKAAARRLGGFLAARLFDLTLGTCRAMARCVGVGGWGGVGGACGCGWVRGWVGVGGGGGWGVRMQTEQERRGPSRSRRVTKAQQDSRWVIEASRQGCGLCLPTPTRPAPAARAHRQACTRLEVPPPHR